jgi:hypothetical protein
MILERIPIFERKALISYIEREKWGLIIIKIWNLYRLGETKCPYCGNDLDFIKDQFQSEIFKNEKAKWLES